MRLDQSHTGSGTHATDFYRSDKGLEAANLLKRGLGANCLSADHLDGNELCVEAIIRLRNDATKTAKYLDGKTTGLGVALAAVKNLEQGVGVHTKQADHSGNTCAQVIAGQSDKY